MHVWSISHQKSQWPTNVSQKIPMVWARAMRFPPKFQRPTRWAPGYKKYEWRRLQVDTIYHGICTNWAFLSMKGVDIMPSSLDSLRYSQLSDVPARVRPLRTLNKLRMEGVIVNKAGPKLVAFRTRIWPIWAFIIKYDINSRLFYIWIIKSFHGWYTEATWKPVTNSMRLRSASSSDDVNYQTTCPGSKPRVMD